jgi:hypothetical protein
MACREFVEVGSPTDDEVHALLQAIITRLMKMLTRRGVLVEEMGQTYLAEPDTEGEEARTLRPLQAAAITYRIAFGPRAGQKVLTLRGAMPRERSAPAPVRRHRRPQPACCGAGRGTRPQAAGTVVPLHHAAGVVRRAGPAQRCRAGGTEAQDTNCAAGELKIIAAILERPVIEKILTHLGLDPQPPPRGRAREAGQDFAA